jgi:hypothetical protein
VQQVQQDQQVGIKGDKVMIGLLNGPMGATGPTGPTGPEWSKGDKGNDGVGLNRSNRS